MLDSLRLSGEESEWLRVLHCELRQLSAPVETTEILSMLTSSCAIDSIVVVRASKDANLAPGDDFGWALL